MIAYIDLIPAGRFIATPASIGSTDEEIDAFEKRELTKERSDEISKSLLYAAFQLNSCMIMGRC
jgi:hypothetical protein